MQNHDELVLRTRRIDPRAPYPVVHQAVRIALYDEYAARSFYARVVEAFGERPPFADIVRSGEQHIAVLLGLCERFGIPRPLDPFPQETTVEPTWLANCRRAVDGEIANVQLYAYLLSQVAEPGARQVFQRLQVAALQNHLPAFRLAAAEAASRGAAPTGNEESRVMRTPSVAYGASVPLTTMTRAVGGGFVQGFVAAGCVAAFQDHRPPAAAADFKRILRHALQGGTALAAGSQAAMAVRRQDYTGAVVATAAGAAGVLLVERLLRDCAKAVQEKKDV